jgi:FkbM family methyltransferase
MACGTTSVRSSDVLSRGQLIGERRIDLVLDVGANEGRFALGLRRDGYAGRIISFEPLTNAFAKIEVASADDPSWECLQLALGAAPGRATLNVAANWASSSLLPMNRRLRRAEPRVAYVGTEECSVATLDQLSPHLLDSEERLYLKLDVQGFELEVLRGAAATLGRVEVLDVELSLAKLYRGAPLKEEVVGYLAARHFALLGTRAGVCASEDRCDPSSRRPVRSNPLSVSPDQDRGLGVDDGLVRHVSRSRHSREQLPPGQGDKSAAKPVARDVTPKRPAEYSIDVVPLNSSNAFTKRIVAHDKVVLRSGIEVPSRDELDLGDRKVLKIDALELKNRVEINERVRGRLGTNRRYVALPPVASTDLDDVCFSKRTEEAHKIGEHLDVTQRRRREVSVRAV